MDLKNIHQNIKWYKKNCKTATIEDLIANRDRLAVNSFYLAEFSADLKIDYNAKYFMRKINILKTIQGLEGAMNLRKARAELKHQEIMDEELQAESEAYKADVLLKSVYKMLEAMSQRISWMKQEKPLAEQI